MEGQFGIGFVWNLFPSFLLFTLRYPYYVGIKYPKNATDFFSRLALKVVDDKKI